MNPRLLGWVVCLAGVFQIVPHAYGYGSSGDGSTHAKLYNAALEQLPADRYADVHKYQAETRQALAGLAGDGSAIIVETFAHGGDVCGFDGPAPIFWNLARNAYAQGNPALAFTYLGRIAHLIQDLTVPAHAFAIPHGIPLLPPCFVNLFTGADNFENFAKNEMPGFGPDLSLPEVGNQRPDDLMTSVRDHTRNTITFGQERAVTPWVLSSDAFSDYPVNSWRDYWQDKSYVRRVSFLNIQDDIFPENLSEQEAHRDQGAGNSEMKLAQHQWGDAVRFVAAMLRTASKSFPPRLYTVQLPATIAQKRYSTLTIGLSDNRSPVLTLEITADGTPIRAIPILGPGPVAGPFSLDGKPENSSIDLKVGIAQPYERTFTLLWDGQLADETYLPKGWNGAFTIVARDSDGLQARYDTSGTLAVRAPAFSGPGQISQAEPGGISLGDDAPPKFRAGGNLGTPALKGAAFSQNMDAVAALHVGRVEAKFDEPVIWTLTMDPNDPVRKKEIPGNGTVMVADWDGKDGKGESVEGSHSYALTFRDYADLLPAADQQPTQGTLVLDNTPPVLTLDSPTPKHFSPNADGQKDVVTVPYTFRDAPARPFPQFLDVVGEVVDAVGRVVRVITPDPQKANSYELTWDGKTDPGVVAPEGTYTLRISVTDNAGNRTTRTSTPFVLDVTPPALTNTFASPFVVTPEGVSTRVTRAFPTLNDNLAEQVVLTANIVDGDRVATVRHLSGFQDPPVFRSLGPVTLLWDGLDDLGQALPDGPYYFRLVTRDDADNETVTYIPVVRNNVPLRISVPDGKAPVTATLGDDGFVVIQGTAMSSTGFASYRLEYALGIISEAEQAMADWRPIPVPVARQSRFDLDYPISPISVLPVQGRDAVLAHWDTKGLDGPVTLRLTVADKSGAVRRLLQTVTIQNPFFLYGLEAAPPLFSPNSDGQQDTTELRYHLSQPAQVTIQAVPLSGGGGPVALQSAAALGKGEQTFVWNGRLANVAVSGAVRLQVDAVPSVPFASAQGMAEVAVHTPGGRPAEFGLTMPDRITASPQEVRAALPSNLTRFWLGYRRPGQLTERWVFLASGTAVPSDGVLVRWRVRELVGRFLLGLSVVEAGGSTWEQFQPVDVVLPVGVRDFTVSPSGREYDPTTARLRARYQLAEPGEVRVTVERGGISSVVLQNDIGTGRASSSGEVTWDGTGVNGFLVPDGWYVVHLEVARLGAPQVVVEDTRAVQLVASPLTVTEDEVIPREFDPTSSVPDRRAARVRFRVNRPCFGGLVIPTADGLTQVPGRFDSRILDGVVPVRSQVAWDGRLRSGALDPGDHTVFLIVRDPNNPAAEVNRSYGGVRVVSQAGDVTAGIDTPTEDAIVDRALGKSGTFFNWHAVGQGKRYPAVRVRGNIYQNIFIFGAPIPIAIRGFDFMMDALTGNPLDCGARPNSTGSVNLFSTSFSFGDNDSSNFFWAPADGHSSNVSVVKGVSTRSFPPGPGGQAPPQRVTVAFAAQTSYSEDVQTGGILSKVPVTVFLGAGQTAKDLVVQVNILATYDKPSNVAINAWPTIDLGRPWDGKPHDGVIVDSQSPLYTGSPNCGVFQVRLNKDRQKRTLEIYGVVGGAGFSRYALEAAGESTGFLPESIGGGNAPVGIPGAPGLLGRWDITGRFSDHKILLSVFNQKNEVLTTARRVSIGDLVEADSDTVQIAGTPYAETKAFFPPGSLPAGSRALVQMVPRSATDEEVLGGLNRAGVTLAGPVVEIQVKDLKAGGSSLIFSAEQPVTLTYTYDPAELTLAQQNQLGIYRFRSDGTLEFLDGFVDTYNHTVTVNITHFSTYVLARDPRRPAPPDLDPIPALVTTASLPLTGRAEPGVTVEAQRAGDTVSVSIPTATPTQVSQPAVPFVLPPVPLVEGDNEIRVLARDRANRLSDPPVILHVRRDTQGPRVTVLEAGPSAIAPDRPGQPQAFTIRFQATEPGTAFLTIRDTQGVVVGAEPVTVAQAGQAVALSWKGRGSDGQFVADGPYTYQLDVLDDAGNRAQDVALLRGRIGVDRIAPVVADLFADPAVFAPDGFSGRASAQVRYTTRDAVSPTVRLAIRVLRADQTEVRMLEMDRVQAVGAGAVTWDGRDAIGQAVVDGGYLVEIVATDEAGNQGAAARVPITVDRRPALDVETVAAVPNAISPNGDQSQDTTEFRYTLRRPGKVGIVIQQGTTLIRELQASVLQVPGAYAVTWDGAAVGGAALPDGSYNLVLTATDESGATLVRTVPVVLDRAAPVAVWSTPLADSVLQGLVTLSGTATDAHPSGFEITFGLGDTPSTFGPITTDSRTVTDGLLGYWDTNGLKGPGIVRLAVTDAAGNRTVAVQSVLLDNPTNQFLIQLEPRGPLAFSPNGDGRQETVQIGYRLRWDATVDAQVMVAGAPVPLLGPVDQLPGESAFTVSWDGKTSGGDRAPPGDYAIQLHAKAIHLPLDETRVIPVTLALDGPSAVLTTPSSGAILRQPIEVVGTATAPLFREYRLEANADPAAGPWRSLVVGRTAQPGGALGTIDPTALPPGPARVRLVVDDLAGLSSGTEVTVTADNRGVAAEWLAPAENAVVVGDVGIRGAVGVIQLANYEVAVAPGTADPAPPASAFKILRAGSSLTDPLAVWKTRDFTSAPMLNGGFETMSGSPGAVSFPGWSATALDFGGAAGPQTMFILDALSGSTGEVFEGASAARLVMVLDEASQGGQGQAVLTSDPFVTDGTPLRVRLKGAAQGGSLTAELRVLIVGDGLDLVSIAPGPDWQVAELALDRFAGQLVQVQIVMLINVEDPQVAGELFVDGVEAVRRVEVREAEGPAILRLRATSVGGQQVETVRRVTVDNSPPLVQVDAPAEGAVLSGVVEVRGTVTDPYLERFLVEFVPDGGGLRIPIGGGRQPVEHGTLGQWDTIDQDGTGTLVVTATDRGGNESAITRRVTVRTGRPFGRLTAPANASRVRGFVSIQGQVGPTDVVLEGYELRLGTGLAPRTFTTLATGFGSITGQLLAWDSRSVPDGAYTLQLVVRANGGRTADETRLAIIVDNVPAELKVLDVVPPRIDPLAERGSTARIRFSLSEGALVTARVQGGGLSRSFLQSTLLPPGTRQIVWDGRDAGGQVVPSGTYELRLEAVNLGGLVSPVVNQLIEVGTDQTPPESRVSVEGPAVTNRGILLVSPTTQFRVESHDVQSGVAGIDVVLDGAALPRVSGPTAGPFRFTTAGVHRLRFRAIDRATPQPNSEAFKEQAVRVSTGPTFFRGERVVVEAEASSNTLTGDLVRTSPGVALSAVPQPAGNGIPHDGWRVETVFIIEPEQDNPEGVTAEVLTRDPFVWPGGILKGNIVSANTHVDIALSVGGVQQASLGVDGTPEGHAFELETEAFRGQTVTLSFTGDVTAVQIESLQAVEFAFAGTWETDWLRFSSPVRLQGFEAVATVENGTLVTEFSVDGQTWRPVQELATVETIQVKFRARFQRANRAVAASPALDVIRVDAVRPLGLDQRVLSPSSQELEVFSSEDLAIPPQLVLGFRNGASVAVDPIQAASGNLFRFQFAVLDRPETWGKTVLTVAGRDLIGTLGESATTFFIRDGTVPHTTLVPSEPLVTAEGRTFLRSNVTLGFTAVDPVVNGFASGVAETRAAVDPAGTSLPGPVQAVTAPLTIPVEGRYSLRFQSEDQAGNVESFQTVPIEVDNTSPTFAGTRTRRVEAEAVTSTLTQAVRTNGSVRVLAHRAGGIPNGSFEAAPFLASWILVSGQVDPGSQFNELSSGERVLSGTESVLLTGYDIGPISQQSPAILETAPFRFDGNTLTFHVRLVEHATDGTSGMSVVVRDVEAGTESTVVSIGDLVDPVWQAFTADLTPFHGRTIVVQFRVFSDEVANLIDDPDNQGGVIDLTVPAGPTRVLLDHIHDGIQELFPSAQVLTGPILLSQNTVGLKNFQALQTLTNGTITHLFTTDTGANLEELIFKPDADLGTAVLTSRQVRFLSDLAVTDVTQAQGPTVDAIQFEEIFGSRVSLPEAKTGEPVQITFPVSEPLRSTPTVTLAVADGSPRLAGFTTQAGLDFTYTYTVQPQDPNGLATIKIAATDRAGNVGQDTSLHVKLITDQEPPVTLVTPDTDLYPDGSETFVRPTTFTLTAIDPGRELVKFDFDDPTLQGQPDPRWRVLSGTWKVEEQAYRGLAGINEENPTIRALSVTDHFTDYILQLKVEDEGAGEDTSVGILIRAQEATTGQVTGGYAVLLELAPSRGEGGHPGRVSLWKRTGPTSVVRLGGARLPQPSQVSPDGTRRQVPVTVVLQGHRIRVAPHGVVVLDVTDPEGPLEGHLGLQVTAANEGGHAARFDDIRLLDLSDLTVASGVTAVETTVASTPETVLTPGTSVTVAITEPGAHTLTYHAIDAAGNAEPSRTLAVLVDTVPPVLALTQAAPEFVASGQVVMTVGGSEPLRLDAVATVNGRAAGGSGDPPLHVTVRYAVTAADAEGPATLALTVRDRAGNLATLTTQPFEVDRTPPAVVLQTPRLAVLNPAGPPGITETVRLPAVISEPGTYQVTLVGPAGGTLRTLPTVVMAGGPVAVSWDGTTDLGLPVDTTGVSWKAVVDDRAGNRTIVEAALTGVPGVGLDVRQPILTNLSLPTTMAADVSEALIRYALHLPQGGVTPVRLTVLTSTGGVVRALLPRPDDPGLRGGGELVERWDGRDGVGRTLGPGAYWVLAEAGGEDAAPTTTRANPALRAFAVVPAGVGAGLAPALSVSSVTIFVPGTPAGFTVSSAPPRSWPASAAPALLTNGAGRVTVGGVRPEGEVRLLQAATDVLTTLLPAGPAVRIEPDAGLPMGTVLVAALPAGVEPDQVGLFRFDDPVWTVVPEQTVSSQTLVARIERGGLYAVLRPTETVAPVVSSTTAPAAFSPNADGRQDALPVAHVTTASRHRLLPRATLTIADSTGRVVHQAVRTQALGAATAVWMGGEDAAPTRIVEGRYTWALQAEDAWGNRSAVVSSQTVLDVTAPVPQFSVASPSAVVTGTLFGQPGTPVTLTGTDPLSGGVAAGVREVRLTLDSPATTLVAPQLVTTAGGVNAAPTLPAEGLRTLALVVEDAAGNVGQEVRALAVDGTPPRSSLTLGQPQCAGNQDEAGVVVVGPGTPLDVAAADPLAGSPPVAAGIALRQMAVDTAPVQSLAGPRTLAGQPEGRRAIRFRSLDAVQNAEAEQAVTVVLDATPPALALTWPTPAAAGLCAVLTGTQVVRGSVADRHLQDYRVEVGAGLAPSAFTVVVGPVLTGAATTVGGALGAWDTAAGPQGWVTLRLIARDCVVNASTLTAQVFVGQPSAQLVTPAGLGHPGYVAVASSPAADGGLVYVTDEQQREVRVLDGTGTAVRRWGQAGNGPGEFNKPEGIAVSSAEVFVADRNNDRVQVFSRTGTFLRQITTIAGATPPGLNKPHGVALDAAGQLYIADRNNDRVLLVDAQTGALIRTVSTGLGVGDLNKPQGVIAVDGSRGRLYVTDRNHDRVLVFRTVDGSFEVQIGTPGSLPGQLNKPDGVAVDADGCLFVADSNNSRIQVWNAFQNLAAVYGSAGTGAGQWNHPGGLALAPDGALWACDTLNKRLQKLGVPAKPAGGPEGPPLRAAPKRPAVDLSALGPPHDFALGPNPAQAGAPVTIFYVSGWTNQESECRVYTAAGELVCAGEGSETAPRAVRWGAPGYAPGRYAVAWSGANQLGQPVASGVYLIQLKVRNPDTGEVVPTLKKVLVIR